MRQTTKGEAGIHWRKRLREAIERSGRKHSIVALEAGVTPETLSRILNAEHQRPALETVVRIAHAVNESVGWLLGEDGFSLSGDETRQLALVVRFLGEALLHSAPFAATIWRQRIRRLRGALHARERAAFSMTVECQSSAGLPRE